MKLTEKRFSTPLGEICYWTNSLDDRRLTLVFLPGLTADHRLFEPQLPFFADQFNVLVWDAPGHGASRPFSLHFTLADKARWLEAILTRENVTRPVLIGQSMGGYVSQMLIELFPDRALGFISIDSAPLQRRYITAAEIWLLKRMYPVYRYYPWKALLKAAAEGCSTTAYGRQLMREITSVYKREEYCALSAHGMRILAEAMESDLSFEISCPARLICGERDMAGSAKSYNRRWAKQSGIPVHWIQGAGHNANTDCPQIVNEIILELLKEIDRQKETSLN